MKTNFLIKTIKELAFTMALHNSKKRENLTAARFVLSKERCEHLLKSLIPHSSAYCLR